MIDILSVNPTGYFSYGRHSTVDLTNAGLVLLEGVNKDRDSDSNGAGKTSLFNAMTHILFGKNPTGHTGEAILNRSLGKCFGIVKFKTDDGLFRIIETRKWRKTDAPPDTVGVDSLWVKNGETYSGTDIYFERFDDGTNQWLDERATNIATGNTRLDMKATRKKILDILGVSYDQFMSIAYLAQQQTVKFLDGGHKERMEIFNEITDLSVWDKRIAKIREDINAIHNNIFAIESKIAGMELVAGHHTTQRSAESIMVDLATALSDIDLSSKNLAIARADRDNMLQTHTASAAAMSELNSTYRRIYHHVSLVTEVLLEVESEKRDVIINVDNIVKEPTRLMDLQEEINMLSYSIAGARMELSELITNPGKCQKCKSVVSDAHILRQRELLLKTIEGNENTIEALKIEYKDAYGLYEEERNTYLDASIAAIDSKMNTLLQIKNYLYHWINAISAKIDISGRTIRNLSNDITIANSNLSKLSDSLNSALSRRQQAEAALAAHAEAQRKSAESAAAISAAQAERAELQRRARHLMAVERLFGDRGMKTQRLDSAIEAINHLLKNSIADISDSHISVRVTKTRDKVDGDKTTDIQVLVMDGSKQDVPYELYSGGEKQQITLAFVTAFWLLATQYGTGVNILCLDEVFGPLDASNTSSMFNFLEKMRTMGKSSIFVVTHNQSIKKSVTFDEVWTATKENDVSTLVRNKQ